MIDPKHGLGQPLEARKRCNLGLAPVRVSGLEVVGHWLWATG